MVVLKMLSRSICRTSFGSAGFRKFTSLNQSASRFLSVSDEVAEALHSGKAVVALESTIVTHGMPYPDNIKTAMEVESVIRDHGAIPATVGILHGKIHIGLLENELDYLGGDQCKPVKTSRRDFCSVISQGLCGGTTVSGTMIAAHLVSIPLFVTGGIGGVHRNGETSLDISADLRELGRTPIAVVSAGVKSLLDIGRTLEYLETEGVPVITYGPDKNFPAFFTRDSGCQSTYNTEYPSQAAHIIDINRKLGLSNGLLFGVPIPEESTSSGADIEKAIQQAVMEASFKGITGKEVTPFILQRVNELTDGASLQANYRDVWNSIQLLNSHNTQQIVIGGDISLIKNNAKVGAQIACCLANLQHTSEFQQHSTSKIDQASSGVNKNINHKVLSFSTQQYHTMGNCDKNIQSFNERSGTSDLKTSYDKATRSLSSSTRRGLHTSGDHRPVVIGGTVIDFLLKLKNENFQFDGASYPGSVHMSFGGVGRNITDCLTRLGKRPYFISAVGQDSHGDAFFNSCSHIDTTGISVISSENTATYCGLLTHKGELLFGVADMDIHMNITQHMISQHESRLASASVVCFDGNISSEGVDYVTDFCQHNHIPLLFEPTDVYKAIKPFMKSRMNPCTHAVTMISPNLRELRLIFEALTGRKFDDASSNEPNLEEKLDEATTLCRTVTETVPVVIVTLGHHGVLLCHRLENIQDIFHVKGQVQLTNNMTALQYPGLHVPSSEIVSVSGAGDCLVTTFLACLLEGHHLDICMRSALLAASQSVRSFNSIPPTINSSLLEVDNEV